MSRDAAGGSAPTPRLTATLHRRHGLRERAVIFRIPDRHVFPDPRLADPSGLLGVGGDLDPRRIRLAYRMGIFPWYSEGQPILWWSPDPRLVLFPGDLVVPRSLRKRLRKAPYRLTMDTAFDEVVARCASVPRPGQAGTWITDAMREAYGDLHRLGDAHSVEAWEGEALVGGLYGVVVGAAFCGESMFAVAPDASKIAFATLVRQLERWGCPLVDCQVHTEHLARFGAVEIPREAFLRRLDEASRGHLPPAPWRFDDAVLDPDLWRADQKK